MTTRMRSLGIILPLVAALPSAGLAKPGKPLNLRCEYQANPLGLGTRSPRLSWQVNDANRGAVQRAYQVVVSTDPKMQDAAAVAWDSGKIDLDQSVLVPYAGKALVGRTRYFWQVRTWDMDGEASDYSEPAWWEMALLEPADWKARWITTAGQVDAVKTRWGDWIWNKQADGANKTAYFRCTVNIPQEEIETAVLKLTADNRFVLYVNGKRSSHGEDFNTVFKYDLKTSLRPGKNVVAVEVLNVDGPGGLITAGQVKFVSGQTIELASGKNWRSAAAKQSNWTAVDFDDSDWSESITMARYGEKPWGTFSDPVPPRRSQCLRQDFTVKGKVARARLYASGLGFYEMHLNGQRVGDQVFAPGWTHYPKRIQYQTHDATELLKEGGNAIGAILGNGWWSGGLGWKGEQMYSRENLRLIAQLEIEYADGSRETIATDGTWQAHPSPITRDSLYHGETCDARLETPGWDMPGFMKEWAPTTLAEEKGTLVPQESEPIRVTQDLPALQVAQVEKGVYIVDFGQNAAGRVRMKVKGPKGTEVRLRFAEVLLPNGQLYRDNYRSAEATDYYILKGDGEEIFEPRFTYRGFRYCEVTGYPGVPKAEAFTSRALHSAAAPAGSFTCSHWLINQVQSNVVWGLRSNFMSVPTDCPQRDERLGWMGDAQAFAPTACWNLDLAAFWSKWMRDITDSQAADGAVTNVSPVLVVSGPAAPGWGDAVVVIPWTVYQYYGDTRIIEENYPAMAAWVEYMRRESKEGLYLREGYSDWVAVVPSPKAPVGAAYCYRSTDLLARMAAVIGKTEDAKKYSDLCRAMAEAFNGKYLREGNDYTGRTQTAKLLPLAFGITPADKQQAVADKLAADVKAAGDHLSTGFLGTPLLLPMLTQYGHHELAWRVASQSTYPSLGYMARQGATTVWERWDTDKQGPGMNSHNHFALGSQGEWYYQAVAGINIDPEHPGLKRVIIRPRPVPELSWAKAEYRSPYGPIRSEWRRTSEGLAVDITVPPNTSAEVWLPLGGRQVATIMEGTTPLLLDGNTAEQVPGVKLLRNTADAMIFEVGAGTYQFAIAG